MPAAANTVTGRAKTMPAAVDTMPGPANTVTGRANTVTGGVDTVTGPANTRGGGARGQRVIRSRTSRKAWYPVSSAVSSARLRR